MEHDGRGTILLRDGPCGAGVTDGVVVTLVLDDLPRSGPLKLDAGRHALELADQLTTRALSSDIVDGVVRIARS